MKVRFIFNPKAGIHGRNHRLIGFVRERLVAEKADASVVTTTHPRHAVDLARTAADEGCEVVVAVGGDGTVNEVAQGLLGTPAALAFLPCGSGNGLALHLGAPRAVGTAVDLAFGRGAKRLAIDAGEVNGRPFFNVMGLGLDADVSKRFAGLSRRGLPAYARQAWSALRERRSERVTVVDGATSLSLEVAMLSIANSDQWGNNARIAPGARVDDGKLDLIALAPFGLHSIPALSARLFLGSFDRSGLVSRRVAPRFRIERAAPGLIHLDGEPVDAEAIVEVSLRCKALQVVVPSSTYPSPSPANSPVQLP